MITYINNIYFWIVTLVNSAFQTTCPKISRVNEVTEPENIGHSDLLSSVM